MLGMAVGRERGKGPTSEGFGGKCSRMHHCALFVAGGLFQGVADGALNRYFWRTFRDEMGVPAGTWLEGAWVHGNRCDCRRWLRGWIVWAAGRSVLCWGKRSTDVRRESIGVWRTAPRAVGA